MAQVAGFLVPVLTGAGGASLATTIFGRLIASVALSALSRALAPRQKLPGLRNQQPMTGEAAPASFILGQYVTKGHKFAPDMAQGNYNKWKQAWLSSPRAIGEGAGYGLVAVYINGERITPEAATSPDGYGNVLEVNGSDQVAWVRWKDGTQTTADAMLLDKHGAHPERPWSADMIGAGVAQAIVTVKRATSVWGASHPWPDYMFEVTGRALWDRRKDSTMGGSGAHRWNNAATWEYSQNPAVMIDNILRGVEVAPGRVWGVKAPGDRIFGTAAAANVCDQAVSISGGGTEPRYRANIEVLATDTPAEIIEELSKACNGALAQLGYGWRFRAGPPGLPVMSITDNDIIITREQDFDPFRQESEIVNAISARFTAPGKGYQPRETSEITNADWLAEDGGKRRHIVVDLPAVTAIRQARRVARAMVKDHRRQRVHVFALGPHAAALEPLDVIAWTSARNGYDGKSFEVLDIADDLMTGVRVLTVREVNPADYDYDTDDDLDDVTLSVKRVRPDMSGVAGLALIDGDVTVELDDLGPSVSDLVNEAKDTADEALAQHVETIRAAETEAARLFRAMAQGHVDLLRGEALHHREQMNVRRNGFRAAIIDERAVRVTEEQALAAQLTSVQAQLDASNIASVTELQTAIATLQGHVAATYSLRLVGGGGSAAFEIVASDDPVEGPASSVFIKADNIRLNGNVTVDQTFWADKLFVQEGWLTSAMIGDAQITSAKIGDAQITSSKIGDAQITSAKIGDLQITRAKIGDQQVVPTYDARGNGEVDLMSNSEALAVSGIPAADNVRGFVVEFSCQLRTRRTTPGLNRFTVRVDVENTAGAIDQVLTFHDWYVDTANVNRYQTFSFNRFVPSLGGGTPLSVRVIFLSEYGDESLWARYRTLSVRGYVK